MAGARDLQTGSDAVDILGLSGSTRALVAAAIAFVPAIVAYVRGRQIARFVDDPALPERLFASRHVTSSCLAFTIATLITITGGAAVWAIPLTVIAYFAAGLPLRRILYNETWSLTFYLLFVIRFFISFWSFWILVCALPALALWAGDRAWIVAFVMGAGLLLLAERQTDLIRWLVGTKPITDAAIRARFDRLVATAGLAAPHFEFVDLKGGSVVNAFALPSLGRAAVVFSGPLLQRLDADEIDAICAHELAHLEYYNVPRLRQRRLVSRSLVVGGAVITPLLQPLLPSLAWIACAMWPPVVLVVIAWLVQGRQKHETASDLRAVALTGNPEALVRALVKLHAIARVPRRWDADLERHMSHPSLKQRIQDIRAAAGMPPAALGDAAVFESSDGAAFVVFLDESLELIEGASASYRLRYDRLIELRIAATRTGETSLLAADRSGRRWQLPLRVDDVPRIQAVLDIVDTRVVTSPPAADVRPMLIRAATFVVLIVSLNAGLFAVAMVLAMTLLRQEAPLVGAAGLAAMAGAVLTWRDPVPAFGALPDEFEAIFAAILLVGGVLLAWLAYARRRDEVPPPVWKLVNVVAVAALASWILPLMGSSGIDVGWPSPGGARVAVERRPSAGARGRDDVVDTEDDSRRFGGCRRRERPCRRRRIAGFSRSVRRRSVPRARSRLEGADARPSGQGVHSPIRCERAATFAGRRIDRGGCTAPGQSRHPPHRSCRSEPDSGRRGWCVVRRRRSCARLDG